MVERINGWKAADGLVYADKAKAVEMDARYKLKELGIFNEATTNTVVRHASKLVEALRELAHEQGEGAKR